MSQLLIAPYTHLLSHSRFLLSLRSKENIYSSLILFRLSSDADTKAYNDEGDLIDGGAPYIASKAQNRNLERGSTIEKGESGAYSQIYVMESACPHLGADMSHADIEDCETGVVAVCPWHRYDFDLRTGKSDTGLRACTYKVEIKTDTKSIDHIYMETPKEGTDWKVVELRPVSEEFADSPPSKPEAAYPAAANSQPIKDDEPVVPLVNPPKTLMEWAVLILNTSNPRLKVERTKHAVLSFRTGKLSSIGHKSANAPTPPDVPSREDAYARNVVDPSKVKNRRNRAAMLHALANIEQWAIDLAWDIMARFGPTHHNLPPAFFADFTKMALDESKHFSLLVSRLNALSPSTPYGSMPVHAGLWESATITSKSLLSRLAIIHLVHEARGLDVNPTTIEKFKRAGDVETVKAMEIIHADEVTHVTAGHRWFVWGCQQEERARNGGSGKGEIKVDPVQRFREEVKKGWTGDIKGPFNVEARERAGLTPEFYQELRGEMGLDAPSKTEATPSADQEKDKNLSVDSVVEGVAALNVEYDKESGSPAYGRPDACTQRGL